MRQKQITIYHNPRCSKSRQTLQLLQAQDYEPEIIEYLKNPPTPDTLQRVLKMLNKQPRELMRTQEEPYKTLKLDDPTLSDQALIQAMCENPILIERPIVVVEQQTAAIGRPPESILALLEQHA